MPAVRRSPSAVLPRTRRPPPPGRRTTFDSARSRTGCVGGSASAQASRIAALAAAGIARGGTAGMDTSRKGGGRRSYSLWYAGHSADPTSSAPPAARPDLDARGASVVESRQVEPHDVHPTGAADDASAPSHRRRLTAHHGPRARDRPARADGERPIANAPGPASRVRSILAQAAPEPLGDRLDHRSEERRVGEEGSPGWDGREDR